MLPHRCQPCVWPGTRGSTVCWGHVFRGAPILSEAVRMGLQIANQDGFQQVAVSYHEALLFFMTTGG